ncbi:FimV family protein [Roseateles sp. BYS78W]|uniref:FimV family protein n=1 Tax=Pelomonas candidula TaxID=3299025 RepID=A0ABW7HEL4_9BURK
MPLPALRPTLLGALTPALALLLGLSPTGVGAMGLGRPQILSALGKPLDVVVPLNLADGEQLTDSCVRAEVSAGDARVPAGLLQMHVEGDPGSLRVRLQSLARIDEPALRITLALGCPLRLTREFNAFIDPPGGAAAVTAPPPVLLPAPPLPVVDPKPRAVADASPVPARPRPRARPKATGPRLVLERPEILVSQAPQRPAPGSAPAPEVTPELEAQITQLEQTVAELRAELEARLQAEAAAASAASAPTALPASAPIEAFAPAPPPAPVMHASPYRDPVTWLLTLGLSLLAGAIAFYGSRWRDDRARRELAYWRALHAAEGAAAPVPLPPPPSPGMAPPVIGNAVVLPDEGQHQATRPQPRPMPWPPAPIAPESFGLSTQPGLPMSMQATQPLPVQATAAPALPDGPTVADELLDLQQQVDFLQLLGQHEAAADLLAARLARGNVGAMPYLLLMELCQQRGEPEVFAELARQFEQRFRVQAPAWSQSLSRGRTLDASASVIAHLQVVWADAGSAMQMLQELLSRGAGPGAPHFDLPAYRDLLMLYGVARDLFEAGLRSDDVDLMLPLDSQFGQT